jgi:phosphoribosylaminoimidazolecarboxamide formyltransferase/IMP cyclohydrolase
VKRALVSVSNKEGVDQLCRELVKLKYLILSTGGTAALLKRKGIPVVDVSEYTQFPEIMDGRVKTLHPKVHGGILADRSKEDHLEAMKTHGIEAIDMVVVNLYPFEETIIRPGAGIDDAIDNIDIGGPAMIRAAAKNHAHVIVLADPKDYGWVLEKLTEKGELSMEERRGLAAKAFAHISRYDTVIASYLERELGRLFPERLGLFFQRAQELRYGENPHQKAAFYADMSSPHGLGQMRQLQGRGLSYNNLLDLHSALALAMEFQDPVAVIVKHNNPCGVATGTSSKDAFLRALECDPVSAYGGIIALNKGVDESVAREIGKLFVEAVISPSFSPAAQEMLAVKSNLRLLELNPWPTAIEGMDFRRVMGGMLIQEPDTLLFEDGMKVVTKRKPTKEEAADLIFAWKVVKHVKSNAIVMARGSQIVGVGAGQTSRVDSVKIAAMKARLSTQGTVLASDAFFPFPDGVEEAARVGVTAFIQPGGSIRDKEVVETADRLGVAMLFTNMRHFRH